MDIRELGQSVSNWGRWGPEDERGTTNLITPAALVAAARLVRQGNLFDRFATIAAACGLPVVRTRCSYHALLQVLDLLYFSWLDWRGPVTGSVEDMSASRPGVAGALMRTAARMVACVAWGEARLLRALPAGCGHFSSVRRT